MADVMKLNYTVSGTDFLSAGAASSAVKKVLRKFEGLNLALIRDEIDGYIEFLDKTFGKGKSNCRGASLS